jgi:UDP-N-acetyl-D-mannosaminuronate dehydrogenase
MPDYREILLSKIAAPQAQVAVIGLGYVGLPAETLAESDCVLMVTNHATYDWGWIRQWARLVVDTRHVTWPVERAKV